MSVQFRSLLCLWSAFVVVCVQPAFAKERIDLACVDCYGTSSFYAEEAAKLFPDLDIHWIHIQSEKVIQKSYLPSFEATKHWYDPDGGLETLDLESEEDVSRVVAILKARGVKGIIGGMETGAVTGDVLIDRLGLVGNDPATSSARREKEPMQKAMGNLAIPTLLSASRREIQKFIDGLSSRRIVIKPNASSSAEGVVIIKRGNSRRDRLAILRAIRTLQAMGVDQYGHPVREVVVQPAIEGTEYVVNSIAKDGVVTITGVWRYKKIQLPNGRRVYFADLSLELDSQEARELQPLVEETHRRLGNLNGPGHGEFIKEESTGHWYLVEQAARVAGAGMGMLDAKVWGTGHLHLNLMRIIDPARYEREVAQFPRKKVNEGIAMFLVGRLSGTVREGANAFLHSLTTLYAPSKFYDMNDGDKFEETEDLKSTAGIVNLVGPPDVVRREAAKVVRAATNGTLLGYDTPAGWRCKDRLRSLIHRVRIEWTFRTMGW